MLERRDPVPLYHQLERRLRERIEAGEYRPGDRLPTEDELRRAYGVSRVTVRTALARLAEDGLITTQRGRGTFVTDQAAEAQKIERHPHRLLAFEDDIRRHGLEVRADVLAVETWPAPVRIARLLGIDPGQEVVRMRRRGWAGDSPLWLESRYFHPRIAESVLAREWTGGSVTPVLQTILGVRIAGARVRISAAGATREQAKYLDIEPGVPVLINEFAFSDATGSAVEAARAVFRADRYAFSFDVSSPEGSHAPLVLLNEGVKETDLSEED